MKPAPAVSRKRRWFQIHLSTAVVLMFVAGGILFLNLKGRPRPEYEDWGEEYMRMGSIVYGWPLDLAEYHYWAYDEKDMPLTEQSNKPTKWVLTPAWNEDVGAEVNWKYALIINFLAGLLVLVSVTYVCEYLIRCREARNP